MHILIKIHAETTEYSPVPTRSVESLEKILKEMVPYILDNVKIEVLVDGLPY